MIGRTEALHHSLVAQGAGFRSHRLGPFYGRKERYPAVLRAGAGKKQRSEERGQNEQEATRLFHATPLKTRRFSERLHTSLIRPLKNRLFTVEVNVLGLQHIGNKGAHRPFEGRDRKRKMNGTAIGPFSVNA